MVTSGSINYWNLTEINASNKDWNSYIERLELFFEANSIERGKRQPILLSTVGVETYKIFKGLVAPVKRKVKSYDELVELIKKSSESKTKCYCWKVPF